MITTLTLPVSLKLTHKAFLDLVAVNPDLQLERTTDGELVIMPPTGGETGEGFAHRLLGFIQGKRDRTYALSPRMLWVAHTENVALCGASSIGRSAAK